MKISNIETRVVSVPLKKPRLWALGCHRGVTRTIIEIFTDEGIIGIGETLGASAKPTIDKHIRPMLIGEDPSNIVRITNKVLWRGGWGGTNIPSLATLAAIEMALWDITGKKAGKPVCDMLGGRFKDAVRFLPCVMATYWTNDKDALINDVVKDIQKTVKTHGYGAIQYYVGVFPPHVDSHLVASIREEFGNKLEIGIDANGSWSPATAIKTLQKMENCELAYVEDATIGLEALARVRATVNMVFSTNISRPSEIARSRAADAIAGDLHDSGGFLGTKKLLAQCELFNLDFWLHSGNELGISFASMIHFISSSSSLVHPSQTTYYWLSDDIIKERFKFNNGTVQVPREPGLGVTIDLQKIEKYNEFYQEKEYVMFDLDPQRPDWFPKIPGW